MVLVFTAYIATAANLEYKVPASSKGTFYDLHTGKDWCKANGIDLGISVANLCELKFKFVKIINGERQSFKTLKGDYFLFSKIGVILMRGNQALVTYTIKTKEVAFEVDQSSFMYASTKPITLAKQTTVTQKAYVPAQKQPVAHKAVTKTQQIAEIPITGTPVPIEVLFSDTFNFDGLPHSFSLSNFYEIFGRNKKLEDAMPERAFNRYADEMRAKKEGLSLSEYLKQKVISPSNTPQALQIPVLQDDQ